jgi:hypothetical protein
MPHRVRETAKRFTPVRAPTEALTFQLLVMKSAIVSTAFASMSK